MIEIVNPYSGANFTHSAENCTATGNYLVENGVLTKVGISGHYTKNGQTYGFNADRDNQGNVNVAGVPADVLPDVAVAVAGIISEVVAQAVPAEPENAE